ncbi:mucin-17-like isoform X2 [Argiope bruennichi]|uniref:Nuclear receptor coactivator 3 like protein n=1 Tax=Argiope bruennichi TaxID=94029 RepID=A0A8T0FT77_ARGBR|nr:mucin-17-like isoform X2 [Argiope bruennichi]KAF8791893.1 Nuclear receptor coactivator 3 like protein [Argiope bruennichi]
MVWVTMSVAPHAGNKKRKKSESKPHSQINKCLNEKRRREQENIHIEELAELVSASPSDMSSLSCKPDKCAILKETVNQIRTQKKSTENELCEELQQSEVSSSKPTIIDNHVFGTILLEALDGFLFIVNCDGKVEFISDNISNFLKFREDEIFEKNIYNFIHPDDQAIFHSNLLLMMPLGNGRDWSADNNCKSNKQAKHFACRFLVKQEEPEIKMENKEPQQPQYENLNITANYMPLDNGTEEPRNGMTCIARRAAFEEKRIGANKIEQFTTRVNREGKVVGVDAGSLSPSSKKFLTEELDGAAILDFCHPNDVTTLKQHLKETFESEATTCVPYKFRIGPERYAKIKAKSKRFQLSPEDDYVISTHSIIRDNDSNLDGQKSIASPSSVVSTSSGPGSVSDSSTSLNGSIVLSPLTLPSSYGNYSNSLSATNNIEMINELNLDLFPDSNWNMEAGSAQSKEFECTSVNSFVSSPQTAPLSNRSETSVAASPINSTFVSGIASSRGGTASVPSPAVQSRAPTPYGGSCYSPSAAQQSTSVRNSPPRALPAKSDSLNSSSTDSTGINSISQGIRVERRFDMKSNEKLRNLLTQSTDDIRSRQSVSRQTSQDDVTVLIDSRVLDGDSARINRLNPQQNIPRNTNVILRDLLNQEEDCEVPVEPIYKCAESAVPNPLLNAGSCKTTENSAQRRMGSNDMLRKLLNTDDSDKGYRKSQDIIHQLLINNPSGKVSLQGDRLRPGGASNSIVTENTVPKPVSISSRQGMSDVTFVTETNALKRKAPEKPNYPNTVKKPNHAHLAGQNPMLAEMLAKTPVTTEVQTSKAPTSLITQLPQEKLPKHLEKKLIHTPYTAGSISATTSSLVFTTSAPTVQRDIVTSDARAHILQHNPQVNVQTALRTVYSSQQQQQLFDKLVSGTEDDILLAKSMASDFMTVGPSTSVQNPVTNYAQLLSFNTSTASNNTQMSVCASDISAAASLNSLLSDNTLATPSSLTDSLQTSQTADTNFDHIILETIYSLQEDHNLTTPQKAINPATILKILSENAEFPETNTNPHPVSVNSSIATSSSSSSTLDINEKIAISAIQKELMEAGSAAIASKANNIQMAASLIPTYSQAGRSLPQVSRTSVQAQLTSEQILLLQQQQLVSGSLPPNYNLVANRVRLPVTTQASVNVISPEVLAQRRNMVHNVTVGNVANMNQLRRTMKQKMYLQQQQKRLLEQQKQQRTIPTQQPLEVASSAGTASFPENINDLLNNTVAPNVTLMRSSGIPEAARFNLNSASSQPSPTSQASPTSAQLSPGQRVNQASPFSPLSQQPFPSQTPPPAATYQAARLSPLPPPSYPQGGPSHSPSPITPTGSSPHMVLSPQSPQWAQRLATSPVQNLQLQNPMLNAQLSQASIGANQIRLTAQQRQQLALRSMPSPTSVQNSRGAVFSPQSEANVSPLSPVMVLQSQAPQQQRIQRTRMASGSQNQATFSTNEPLLSPQSLPSPSFSQSVSTTPTSSYVSISSSSVPISYSATQVSQQFTFDRQNIQAFASSSNDSLRSPGVSNDQGASDSLPQELRSLVNSPNLVLSSSNNQQLLQSLSSNNSVTRVLNLQSLTRSDLEELGLSVELLPSGSTEAQAATQALFAQALLNDASNLEASVQPTSPRVQVEEPKPADQKKSLLQQLLSEPT